MQNIKLKDVRADGILFTSGDGQDFRLPIEEVPGLIIAIDLNKVLIDKVEKDGGKAIRLGTGRLPCRWCGHASFDHVDGVGCCARDQQCKCLDYIAAVEPYGGYGGVEDAPPSDKFSFGVALMHLKLGEGVSRERWVNQSLKVVEDPQRPGGYDLRMTVVDQGVARDHSWKATPGDLLFEDWFVIRNQPALVRTILSEAQGKLETINFRIQSGATVWVPEDTGCGKPMYRAADGFDAADGKAVYTDNILEARMFPTQEACEEWIKNNIDPLRPLVAREHGWAPAVKKDAYMVYVRTYGKIASGTKLPATSLAASAAMRDVEVGRPMRSRADFERLEAVLGPLG